MTIRDIARLAKVTPGTVSKVLNDYPDISEATKQHVLRIIEENQYDPKANARSGKNSQEQNRIELVVEGVYNELYTLLTQTLSIKIHNAGYTIVSFHDNFYVQNKLEKFQELKAKAERDKVCAMIYIGGNFQTVPQKEFDTLPCPVIFVNTMLPMDVDCTNHSSIQVTHFETAYAQMSLLAEKGHRDICMMISSSIDNSVYSLRVDGCKAALCRHRLEHNFAHILESDYQNDRAYNALMKYLPAHPEITAICSVADVIVPGILRAIRDCGKVPGKDIDVISFDGLDSMAYSCPSVTTFAQPLTEMANFIDSHLFGLISKEASHQRITFQPQLLRRESC